jgi:hypothetical protein
VPVPELKLKLVLKPIMVLAVPMEKCQKDLSRRTTLGYIVPVLMRTTLVQVAVEVPPLWVE